MLPKFLSEFIGNFALVFCGTGAIIVNEETGGAVSGVGIAITFGLIVMAMIYALGEISGAHFNPAVTIAFVIAKRFSPRQVVPYIVSQVAGALLASGILRFLFPDNELLGSTIPRGPISGASLNPARSIAPAIISGHLENIWIYIAAPIAGASFSIPVYTILVQSKKL